MLQKVNFSYRLLNGLTKAGRVENRLISSGVVKQLSENSHRFSAGDFYARKLPGGKVMLKGYDPSSLTSDVTYIVDKSGAYSQVVRLGRGLCEKLGLKNARLVQEYNPSGLINNGHVRVNAQNGESASSSIKDVIESVINSFSK